MTTSMTRGSAFAQHMHTETNRQDVTDAEVALVDAEAKLAANPDCPVARAEVNGAEEWLRQVRTARRLHQPHSLDALYSACSTELLSIERDRGWLPMLASPHREHLQTVLTTQESEVWEAIADAATSNHHDF